MSEADTQKAQAICYWFGMFVALALASGAEYIESGGGIGWT